MERLKTWLRRLACKHESAFEIDEYTGAMNEMKRQWTIVHVYSCPVCGKQFKRYEEGNA